MEPQRKKVETLARPTQQVDPLSPPKLREAAGCQSVRDFGFGMPTGLFQEQSGNDKNSLLCSCNNFHSLVSL
jgi:hypothetical protein